MCTTKFYLIIGIFVATSLLGAGNAKAPKEGRSRTGKKLSIEESARRRSDGQFWESVRVRLEKMEATELNHQRRIVEQPKPVECIFDHENWDHANTGSNGQESVDRKLERRASKAPLSFLRSPGRINTGAIGMGEHICGLLKKYEANLKELESSGALQRLREELDSLPSYEPRTYMEKSELNKDGPMWLVQLNQFQGEQTLKHSYRHIEGAMHHPAAEAFLSKNLLNTHRRFERLMNSILEQEKEIPKELEPAINAKADFLEELVEITAHNRMGY